MEPRYDTPAMTEVWSNKNRNDIERTLWVSAMEAQQKLGVGIPDEAIASARAAAEQLAARSDVVEYLYINELELAHGHDLYARLQYFNLACGHDWAHRGLTSADITENTQQTQVHHSCDILSLHGLQVAARLARTADLLRDTEMVARTHGRPAQITTIGKRYADWLDALLEALNSVEEAAEEYSPRGLKGAVGTNADLADLLGSAADAAEVDLLFTESIVSDTPALISTGQCYPRGNDLPLLAAAMQLVAVCEKIAVDIRLMALLDHVAEQPRQRQVGSSAMPHKLNPRYSERVASLVAAAWGYFAMLTRHQPWLEGDVSTSAVRRIGLPGLFHAVDAALANTAFVLDSLVFNSQAIGADVYRWLPLLASGRLLAETLRLHPELTRDQVHTALRECADAAMQDADPGPVFLGAVAIRPEFAGVDIYQVVTDCREGGAAAAAAMVRRMLAVVDLPELDGSWPGDLL